jgi:hypothetical protein
MVMLRANVAANPYPHPAGALAVQANPGAGVQGIGLQGAPGNVPAPAAPPIWRTDARSFLRYLRDVVRNDRPDSAFRAVTDEAAMMALLDDAYAERGAATYAGMRERILNFLRKGEFKPMAFCSVTGACEAIPALQPHAAADPGSVWPGRPGVDALSLQPIWHADAQGFVRFLRHVCNDTPQAFALRPLFGRSTFLDLFGRAYAAHLGAAYPAARLQLESAIALKPMTPGWLAVLVDRCEGQP